MICILGNDAFSYYLAAQFAKKNKEVVLLSSFLNHSASKEITIREGSGFTKENYIIKTTNNVKDQADFLIITAPLKDLKTELLNINQGSIKNAQIICLTGLKENSIIKKFIAKNIDIGFYEGYISKKNDTIYTSGYKPEILLPKEVSKDFVSLFSKADISVQNKLNTQSFFLKWFSFFSLNFLLTTSYNKSGSDLFKGKQYRILIENLAKEITQALDPKEKTINKSDLIASISAISNHAIHSFSHAEFNFIKKELDLYNTDKIELNKLIKTIYNKYSL